MYHYEKWGGQPQAESHMSFFRQVLEENDLFDFGRRGDKFTWCNKQEDDTFIEERLDREVANAAWISKLKEVIVDVLDARCSHRRPLLTRLDRSCKKTRKKKTNLEGKMLDMRLARLERRSVNKLSKSYGVNASLSTVYEKDTRKSNGVWCSFN